MKKIPLKNRLGETVAHALVDDEDYRLLSMFKWYRTAPHKYPGRTVTVDGKKVMVHLHRSILWCPLSLVIDHINGNVLDNRRSNLRIATRSQNLFNSKKPTTNTSGFKGAVAYPANKKKPWKASIQYRGKTIHIGYFKTKEEASEAYQAKAQELSNGFSRK